MPSSVVYNQRIPFAHDCKRAFHCFSNDIAGTFVFTGESMRAKFSLGKRRRGRFVANFAVAM